MRTGTCWNGSRCCGISTCADGLNTCCDWPCTGTGAGTHTACLGSSCRLDCSLAPARRWGTCKSRETQDKVLSLCSRMKVGILYQLHHVTRVDACRDVYLLPSWQVCVQQYHMQQHLRSEWRAQMVKGCFLHCWLQEAD